MSICFSLGQSKWSHLQDFILFWGMQSNYYAGSVSQVLSLSAPTFNSFHRAGQENEMLYPCVTAALWLGSWNHAKWYRAECRHRCVMLSDYPSQGPYRSCHAAIGLKRSKNSILKAPIKSSKVTAKYRRGWESYYYHYSLLFVLYYHLGAPNETGSSIVLGAVQTQSKTACAPKKDTI